jgi:hypothetical protein
MSRHFPDYFRKIRNELNKENQRHPGCYRDLFLAQDLSRNPYQWLDLEMTEMVEKATERLRATAVDYAEQVVELAQRDAHPSTGDPVHDVTTKRLLLGTDHPDTSDEFTSVSERYKNGVDQQMSGAKATIEQSLQAFRSIKPAQFTIRRCFPTFKLFFVEEDSQGVLKAFDEFYSYNAVINWNLMEYTTRPATLVVTVSNLFNHLDAVILSEGIDAEDRKDLALAAIQGGILPSQQVSSNRVDVELSPDGRPSPIRNIMLKTGTKVVLKAGYDNDPKYLETVFSGQVTEVHPGDVMTIICQDWVTELLGSWEPDLVDNPTDIGRWESIWTNHEDDITGTAGTKMMMKSLLSHAQCRHFGHWQIGEANPFSIYSNNLVEQRASKDIIAHGIPAGDRSMANVRPSLTPFFSAFGRSPEVVPINPENKSLWETMLELKLRHPNDQIMVRPYGQGDATIYFGPPYGFYTSSDFTDKRGQVELGALDSEMFRIFSQLIDSPAYIRQNELKFDESQKTASFDFDDDLVDKAMAYAEATFTGDTGINAKPVPLYAVLANEKVAKSLFSNTSKGFEYYADRLKNEGGQRLTKNRQYGLAGAFENFNNLSRETLGQGVSDAIKKIWWDALQDNRYTGTRYGTGIIRREDRKSADLLNYVRRLIDQAILLELMSSEQELIDRGETPERAKEIALMQKTLPVKPVRNWHIITSKHHIIANNIQVNSDFANRVIIGETEVKYDPGLEDVRTRQFNQFDDKHVNDATKGFMSVELLRREMRRMYSGEIILTGNPGIRPYDILVIVDQIRQIFGIVEVDKVQHSMSMEHGFITIITPALVAEAGDMTISMSYQSFYNSLAADLEELSDQGALGKVLASVKAFQYGPASLGNIEKFRAQNVQGTDARIFAGSSLAAGAGIAGLGVAGATGLLSATVVGAPLALILGGSALLWAGWTYFSMQNNALKDHIKTHPLTITPLVKRGWPWIAGIDGANGRTAIGQWGLSYVEGWQDFHKMLDAVRRVQTTFQTASSAAGGTVSYNPVGNNSLKEFKGGNLPTKP